MKNFDKKAIYKTQIEPIIHELKRVCNLEKMPMFVTVAVKDNGSETEYKNEMVLASSGRHLADNRIASILLKLNGFELDLPDYILKDIKEINEFLDRTSIKNEDSVSTVLNDDILPDLMDIANGEYKTVPPKGLLHQEITLEEAEGIDTAQQLSKK